MFYLTEIHFLFFLFLFSKLSIRQKFKHLPHFFEGGNAPQAMGGLNQSMAGMSIGPQGGMMGSGVMGQPHQVVGVPPGGMGKCSHY